MQPWQKGQKMKTIFILNGPNLNLLGKRQPEIYGTDTLDDVQARCAAIAGGHDLNIDLRQTNHEGEMVDWIQEAREAAAAIIINPAAWSHTSVAVLDALHMFEGPVMEVHISNIHQREAFRHHSYVSQRAEGIVVGCGVQGYELALQRAIALVT